VVEAEGPFCRLERLPHPLLRADKVEELLPFVELEYNLKRTILCELEMVWKSMTLYVWVKLQPYYQSFVGGFEAFWLDQYDQYLIRWRMRGRNAV